MKHWLPWLLGVGCILFWQEIPKTDLSRLYPVQTVAIQTTQGKYRIYADNFAVGTGKTLEQALTNLKTNASAELFLETADYLLLDTQEVLEEAEVFLRPGTKVAVFTELPDMETVGKYLSAHPPEKTLREAVQRGSR